MQHSAVLSTSQHITTQHSTAQHNTAQHSTAQHSTAQHSTAQAAKDVYTHSVPKMLSRNQPSRKAVRTATHCNKHLDLEPQGCIQPTHGATSVTRVF